MYLPVVKLKKEGKRKRFNFCDPFLSFLTKVVVVVTRPLPRDGGMAEDHGAPETGQLNRAWIEVVKRQRVAKKRAAQRVCSWTVQNEMCPQALHEGFSILPILER